MSYIYSNLDILRITSNAPRRQFVQRQQKKWYAHCVRASNDRFIKKLFYETEKGRGTDTLKKKVEKAMGMDELQIIQMAIDREF